MLIKRALAGLSLLASLVFTPALAADAAPAQTIDEALPSIVTLGALDKITAKVTQLEIAEDKPFTFGTLEITLRTCHSNPPEEAPETAAFLEISEARNGQKPLPLFTGWMFASTPSLSALDHPVYDVWVISCKTVSGAGSVSSR
jgi:hypothetical protein